MPPTRPFWKGYLKLSLVSCPIALFPASSSSERVTFRQINKKTGHRLKQQLVDSVTGEVVEPQDKGRGYQVGKDEYLPVEDEELDSLALESTKIIDLEKFVTRSEIDVPARAPSAEDNQPKEAPASPDTNYNDASHTVLLYQDVVGVLGKEVRSSAGENLGRIVDLLVDQTGQVRRRMTRATGRPGVCEQINPRSCL